MLTSVIRSFVIFDVSSLFTNGPIEDTLDFFYILFTISYSRYMPFNSDVLLKLI